LSALDFPASPSDGDTYAGYVFNAAKNVWQWQALTPSLVSLTDTDIVTPSLGEALVYDGAKWVNDEVGGGGKILQVVQTAKTNTFSTTSTSFTTVTGLTATITPSSTNSKILVMAQVANSTNSLGGVAYYLRLAGGNATTYVGDAAGSRARTVAGHFDSSGGRMESSSLLYLDSPNTTSATTYEVQISSNPEGTTGTVFVNRTATDTDNGNNPRGASSITLMEVAG
jgi:hypothetical protein